MRPIKLGTMLLQLLLVVISGCAPQIKYIPAETSLITVDFSKYAKTGFLITPHDYSGEYEAMGLISISVVPEARLVSKSYKHSSGPTATKEMWDIGQLDINTIIEALHKRAVSLGADAIIDFKVTTVERQHGEGTLKSVKITGYELEGFAIKRVGAFK